MSADPLHNTTSIVTSGDITSGRGMFGMTTSIADTAATPILQAPGTFYSNYYSHYGVSLSQNGEFILDQIGTSGLSVGYTMCIDCTTGPGQLTVRAFDLTIIAVMVAGDKLFLTAQGATSNWRSSFAVPQGQNNYLLVYNGSYPRVQTLPIQKELSIDGSQRYGIKCLTSFDFSEPAFWTAVAQTNLNRIVSLANSNTLINTTGLTGIANHVTLASDTCGTILTDSSLSSIMSSKSCNMTPTLGSASTVIASAGSTSTTATGLSAVVTSNNATISHNGTGSSTVIGSSNSSLTTTTGNNFIADSVNTSINGPTSTISAITSTDCTITSSATARSSIIACNNSTFDFDGISLSSSIANIGLDVKELRNSAGTVFIGTNSSGIGDNGGTSTSPFLYSFLIGTVSSTMTLFPATTTGTIASGVLASTNSNISTGSVITSASVVSACNNSSVRGTSHSHITASETCTINTGNACIVAASSGATQTNAIITSVISSDTTSVVGNGDNTFSSVNGYSNTAAGRTILSSHNPTFVSASDLRYCVMGGYNTMNWSIDSKTGNYYGAGIFNAGTPLPGLAEMYENIVDGKLPYGRLLQIEDGKVRLATNGEVGFMISRPYETAAFVGGNPYYDWPKKFLTDEFGLPIYKDYTIDEYKVLLSQLGQTDDEIKSLTDNQEGPIRYKVLNPDFDLAKVYIPRSNREDQWTTCEKSGIVVIEYKGSLSIGDCVVSAGDGVAKQSIRKTNIKVIEVIDERFAKVDIENVLTNDYVDVAGSAVSDVSKTSSYSVGLPADVAIRSLSFADDTLKLAKPTKLKLNIDVVGDMSLATDLLVCLKSDSITLWFDTVYARSSGAYKVKSTLKAIVPTGDYKINFVTSKSLPTKYTGCVKLY